MLISDWSSDVCSSDLDAFSQATGSWLTRELAELRWRALLDRRSGVRWSGSSQQMRLDLNAAREGLRTRAANDYNRTWNMSLLNLMQRAGVLEVISVNTDSGDEAPWVIEIREPAILSESEIDRTTVVEGKRVYIRVNEGGS